MKRFEQVVIAAMALLVGAPAMADVKAGVDAWGRGEFKKAVEEWRGPAVAGDPDAQFNLAQAYKLGRGVTADLAMAEEWYRKAALQAHPQAEDNYGLTLFQNNKRDLATPWLEKSAARGEPRAQFVLGTMYFNGDSVKRDWVKAYGLMTRASAAGLPQASSTLAQMDRYIGLNERQQGAQLARKYEAEAGRPQLAELAGAAPRDEPPVARRSGAVIATRVPPSSVAADAPPPVRTPKPATAIGAWRVQLGAFRDVGNARGLFTRLSRGPLAGKQEYLVRSGAVTRLLAGPYATQADAARACGPVRAAGSDCVPTRG